MDFLCFQEIFPCTDASCIKLIFSAEGAKNLSVYGLVHRSHLCVPSVLALGPWQDLTLLCHSSSLGWNKRIEYTPGAGSLALFPSIHLETCDEPLWNIQATVELQTNHVAKGCDRDNYSEKSLRKLCGELSLS